MPSGDTIPMDLIAEILARLPVKSILRFMCVCKSCSALISDPQFVKKQLLTSAANPSRHHVIVAHCNHWPRAVTLKDHSLPSLLLSINSSIPPTSSELDLKLKNSLYILLGYCHGVLCLAIPGSSPVLWNPSTRKFKNLPSLNRPDSAMRCSGFGYDHLTDSYKVVVAVSTTGDGYGTDVMVHTLGTDSWWRLIQKLPADLFLKGDHDGKFVSGTLNWLCVYNNNLSSSGRLRMPGIVSLDLGSETCQQLLLPDCIAADTQFGLKIDALKGCLCILHQCTVFAVDVWVMKDYGNKQSWTKLLSLPSIPCMKKLVYLVPGALWISDEDDEILFTAGLDLAVYNSKSATSKFYEIQNHDYINAAVYVESLISP